MSNLSILKSEGGCIITSHGGGGGGGGVWHWAADTTRVLMNSGSTAVSTCLWSIPDFLPGAHTVTPTEWPFSITCVPLIFSSTLCLLTNLINVKHVLDSCCSLYPPFTLYSSYMAPFGAMEHELH
jgi:hypothetical protein